MRGALRTLLFTACALAALSAPAYASTDDWGDDIEVMDDAEMDDLRGGFDVASPALGAVTLARALEVKAPRGPSYMVQLLDTARSWR